MTICLHEVSRIKSFNSLWKLLFFILLMLLSFSMSFFKVHIKSLDFDNSVFFDKEIYLKNRITIDRYEIRKVNRHK